MRLINCVCKYIILAELVTIGVSYNELEVIINIKMISAKIFLFQNLEDDKALSPSLCFKNVLGSPSHCMCIGKIWARIWLGLAGLNGEAEWLAGIRQN